MLIFKGFGMTIKLRNIRVMIGFFSVFNSICCLHLVTYLPSILRFVVKMPTFLDAHLFKFSDIICNTACFVLYWFNENYDSNRESSYLFLLMFSVCLKTLVIWAGYLFSTYSNTVHPTYYSF